MFTKSKDTASQVYFHSVFSLSVNLSCFHVLNYYQIDLTSHLKGWQALGHDLKVRSNLPENQ